MTLVARTDINQLIPSLDEISTALISDGSLMKAFFSPKGVISVLTFATWQPNTCVNAALIYGLVAFKSTINTKVFAFSIINEVVADLIG